MSRTVAAVLVAVFALGVLATGCGGDNTGEGVPPIEEEIGGGEGGPGEGDGSDGSAEPAPPPEPQPQPPE